MGDVIPFPVKPRTPRRWRRVQTLLLTAGAACALAAGLYGAGQDLLKDARSAEAGHR